MRKTAHSTHNAKRTTLLCRTPAGAATGDAAPGPLRRAQNQRESRWASTAQGGAAAGPVAAGTTSSGSRQSSTTRNIPGHAPASRYLVGGVNSPVRAFGAVKAEPVWLSRGRGAFVTDLSGRRLLDFIMGWGALILGHSQPTLIQAIRRQLNAGILLGLTTRAEAQLAKAIAEAMPSIEQLRFMPSGTEACMTAIRLARAATGRPLILTFEGCYHGHSDGLLVKRGSGLATLGLAKSRGVPEAVASETLVVPYQDRPALEEAFARFGPRIAAAIIEPIAANMGVVVPAPSFLARLRELTRRHGSLLLFDEVVTGFRVAYGGAQSRCGVTPDLTVLGKIIGGGLPIGAVGGSRRLMQELAPVGAVYHAGTFAGHPLSMAAGLATLRELKRRRPYPALEALGGRLASHLSQAASNAGLPLQVNRAGSMMTVFFSRRPVTSLAQAQQSDASRFVAWANGLRRRGILLPPSPYETLFLSTEHTERQVRLVVEATAELWAAGGH